MQYGKNGAVTKEYLYDAFGNERSPDANDANQFRYCGEYFDAETGDIYLVADVLGHKDVNTTRKHYAAQDESRRRSAANVVKLRKE